MKKSRVWQAIVPGTQTRPQDTLQIRKTPWHGVTERPPAEIRKTPWHGVTEQPPAVPLPGPNVTPEPNEKSRVWQAIVPGTQTKPQDTLRIRKTPWHGVTEQPPAVPLPGQTSLLNRMKNHQGSGRQLFQAHKPSHKTPFESGKHPGTA